jgi:hypothetical protein
MLARQLGGARGELARIARIPRCPLGRDGLGMATAERGDHATIRL